MRIHDAYRPWWVTKVLTMPSDYDEMSERAHPGYPGGRAAARGQWALLRRAMEAEGFTVESDEGWHGRS